MVARFFLPEVRKQSEVVWEDKVSGNSVRVAMGLLLMGLLVLLWQYRSLPAKVPLFYSQPWGEAQLASPWGLFLLPGTGVVVLIINGLLASLIFEKQKLLARILLVGVALTSFLTIFTLFRILLLIV